MIKEEKCPICKRVITGLWFCPKCRIPIPNFTEIHYHSLFGELQAVPAR